jgi:hypothetical protein
MGCYSSVESPIHESKLQQVLKDSPKRPQRATWLGRAGWNLILNLLLPSRPVGTIAWTTLEPRFNAPHARTGALPPATQEPPLSP